jgi:RimJ/RimL family protein N-acetyltransferase
MAPTDQPGPAADLRGDRVLLRQWRAGDRAAFAALNADPAVMEHFPAPLSGAESDAFADRIIERLERDLYGLWALEVPGDIDFAGFVGLNPLEPTDGMPFTPAVEIGWRLAQPAWGRGLACEAARLVVAYSFEEAELSDLVSMTSVTNERSRGVMARIGMAHDPSEDFDHPRVPRGHRLERHVLYRLSAAEWQAPQERAAP